MKQPPEAQMQAFAAEAVKRITWRLWDGVSPIGSADADFIRQEYGGGSIYQILADGVVAYTQGHAPGAEGRVAMSVADAERYAAIHTTEIRNRHVETRCAEVMAPWQALRADRDLRLTEADHQINAATDTGKDDANLRRYRQALRDVTIGLQDPADVVWPTKPWA